MILVLAVLLSVHNRLFTNSNPTTSQLQEYLKKNQLQAGEDTINGYRQIHYSMNNTVVYITNDKINHTSPRVSGSKIVWLEELVTGRQVFMYDVLTRQKTQLTFAGNHQNPHIDGTNIVWESWNGDAFQIKHYDGQETRQISNGRESVRPVVQQNKIAYVQRIENNNWRILVYDTSSKKTEALTTVPGKHAYPRFVNGEVVPGPFSR